MALQPHELTALVGTAGICGTLLATVVNLREARRRTHVDRLWGRCASVYEEFLAYQVRQQRRRYLQMTEPEPEPFEVDPMDDEDDLPMLSRLELYGSPTVLLAAKRADDADRAWRRAYADWQGADRGSEEMKDAESRVGKAWELADTLDGLVSVLIKREIRSGKRLTGRWVKRLRRADTDHPRKHMTVVYPDEPAPDARRGLLRRRTSGRQNRGEDA